MPRPPCCRRIASTPGATLFKPAGVPARELDEVVLHLDEFEAIRLADLVGEYHEQAASRMQVSRQTFGRILESARRKVAEALVTGKALRIEGGPVFRGRGRTFRCPRCSLEWHGPQACPRCFDASGGKARSSMRGR